MDSECTAILLLFIHINRHKLMTIWYQVSNETPGELSHESLISSHVTITCYLHMWKDPCCYGCKIYGTFCSESEVGWLSLVFIKWIEQLYMAMNNISATLKEKFWIYAWLCNILYLVYTKTVDSVKCAHWLACQTPNILHYLPPSNSGKNGVLVCVRYKWRSHPN